MMRPNLVVLELGEHSSVVKRSPDPAMCPPRPPLPLRPDLAVAAVVRAVVASRCGDAALPAFTDWLLGHHRDYRLPTRGHHPSQPAGSSGQRTLSSPVTDPSKLPKWNYDGSSTGQAPSEDSEVILYPQAIFKDPIRRGNNILFAVENSQIKPKKTSSVPMKTLIDEEFSKDVTHTSPGVVGRLMGLDSLPSFGAHSQNRYTQNHAQKTSPGNSHDRSIDEIPEVKDVFEVMEATRMKINRSPRSRNGNVTSRFDKTDNVDLDFVRQKFMDAKRLSTDESLQMSEEFTEKLDA